MTKAKEQCKAAKNGNGSKENGQKIDEKHNGNNDQIVNSAATKKDFQLPRQMIRVQRSEPSEGIIRNELRFVSYSAKDDNGSEPLEKHIVSEAFIALVSRLRDLQ